MADWATVAAYLLSAWLSGRAARQARHSQQAGEHGFWQAASVLLVILGVNELLDLQTILASIGRAHAKENGWYAVRRSVQFAFVAALVAGALLASMAMLWLTWRMHIAVRLALLGFIIIGLFVLVRAASFHHLDDVLAGRVSEFNLGSVQEMAGILVVSAAAVLYLRNGRNMG